MALVLQPFSILQQPGPPVLILDVYIQIPGVPAHSTAHTPFHTLTLIVEIPGASDSASVHNIRTLHIWDHKLWLLAIRIASAMACAPDNNPTLVRALRVTAMHVHLGLAKCSLASISQSTNAPSSTPPLNKVTLHQSWLNYFLRRAPSLLNLSPRIIGRFSLKISFPDTTERLPPFVGFQGIYQAADHITDSDLGAATADSKDVLWLKKNDPAAFLQADWC